jgi:hypothetical protein
MNLRRIALDVLVVVGSFFVIQGFAYFYLAFIAPYHGVSVGTDPRSLALASTLLLGGLAACVKGLLSRKSALLTNWEVLVLASIVVLFVNLLILPMGYFFFPVDNNLIFAVFVLSLFGVVVGYFQFHRAKKASYHLRAPFPRRRTEACMH